MTQRVYGVSSLFQFNAASLLSSLSVSLCICVSVLISLCALVWAQTPTPAPSPTPTPKTQIKYITLPAPTPTPFQPNELHQWGAVTLFHGLPSDRVRAITQGPDGALWFGTDAGLARYDGRRTQAISAEGLPTGRVSALLADEDGTLWIGTENGAARFSNGVFTSIPETKGQGVNAILQQSRGRVWFATAQGQVFDCQANGNGFNTRALLTQPLPSADADKPGFLNLTSLAYHNNTLYAGSRSRGVFAIRDNGTAEEIYSRPRSYFINALETDTENRLWSGADAGKAGKGYAHASDLWRPKPSDFATGTVNALRRDARAGMWVGTDGRGVFTARDGKNITFANTAGGLRSDHIYAIFVDREDVVWFGTDKGISRYDRHAPQVENLSDNPNSNFIRVFSLFTHGNPNNDFFLAGTNRGLFIQSKSYSEPSERWQAIAELGTGAIYSITHAKLSDDKARVLVGSANGLYEANYLTSYDDYYTVPTKNKAFAFKRLPTAAGEVRAVAIFQGAPYFSTFGRGLERWDSDHTTMIWPTNGDATREVISLEVDDKNHLWIGTANAGAFIFEGQEARPVTELASKTVRRIVAEKGKVWLATSQGLYVYQDGQPLQQFTPNIEVRDVLTVSRENTFTAWCATVNNGVLKVVMDEKFGPVTSRLDAEQGLPSNSAFALSHDLLIGTNRGLVRYEPSDTPPMLMPARILSKRVHAPEEARAGLRLEYPQNSLLLEMSAIASRTFPEQFQYGFRLLDGKGQVVAQKLSRDAQFTMENLKPGRYRVESVAFSRDLVASETFAFDLEVERAPFRWFTLLLGVLLALSLAALWWGWRKNSQLTLAGVELRDARERLAHEAETERRRIARDLHDQTLADLRRLALLTDELPAGEKTARFRGEVEEVSQEIRRICEDLSPSALENVGLAAALEFALSQAVAQAPPKQKFEYEFTCDDDLEEKLNLTPAEQIQIFRIAQEAVANISRHARASRVTGRAAIDENSVFVFTLEDDGDGFTPDAPHANGRGLANMQARAGLLEAEISWENREAGGTVFRLVKNIQQPQRGKI